MVSRYEFLGGCGVQKMSRVTWRAGYSQQSLAPVKVNHLWMRTAGAKSIASVLGSAR